MSNATGPWRTDVENAPKDEWIVVLAKTGEYRIVRYNNLFDCWHDDPEYLIHQYQIECFAVINPITTTAPEPGAGEQG